VNITVDMSDFGKLAALTAKMRPAGRSQLNRVGVYAAMATVKRHIHGYAMGKHFSATRLGASPTGHYEKGAAAISCNANADMAEVIIPIPGISRAYHDLIIRPIRANRLTIPINAVSYGHTCSELKARGWKFFSPPKGHEHEDIIFGYRGKGKNRVVKPLYLTKTVVEQRKDPRLLPSKPELGRVFARSQADEIRRVMRKAGR